MVKKDRKITRHFCRVRDSAKTEREIERDARIERAEDDEERED